MRAKQLFSRIPVPAKIKLVYARLTLNKLTTIYFVVAIIHCVLQVIFQLAAHAINVNARHLVSNILEQAKLTMGKFAIIENKRRSPEARESELNLILCKGIPGQFGLTGKDVCNVLWSQSRGLVNDTLEDFLSPSSDDDHKDYSESSDSEDENKTKTQRLTSTSASSAVVTALPAIAFNSTSSAVATTPRSGSSTSIFSQATRTSTSSVTTSSSKTSSSSLTSVGVVSSSSVSSSLAFAAPTDVANLIKPGSESSDSNKADSPSSDDESGLVAVRVRGGISQLKKEGSLAGVEKREGGRKVFDREKLRPLSLPPRSPVSPLTGSNSNVDIDESHPNLDSHRHNARVAPMTPALLRRARARDGLSVEFVPIAPKRAVNSKRSTLPRPKRALWRRVLTEQDQRDVIVTSVFTPNSDPDDGKKSVPVSMNMAGTVKEQKSKLVSVTVSGLITHGAEGPTSLVTEGAELAVFGDVQLSPGCALALSWPAQVLRDFAREDLAMIGFQVWLLGMSVVAILNESIPHLFAGVFTQALSTGWSAFQMARSSSFKAQYETTIVRGACAGADVLPDYFTHRTKDEIPIVALNGIFLVVTIVLSWRMCRVYGWQTFKRIGASHVMNQAYRLVLAFSIHLQLAIFFFVTSSALWVDELLNGPVAYFAEHRSIYTGVFVTSVLLLLPWLILGWIGVRRENKHMMHTFLFISFLFITAWAAMFASDVYRWTFATWPFFAAMTVVSYVVLIVTTGLAVVCRFNFTKGLALFLQSQQILPGAEFSDALSSDPEKVEFPDHRSGGELPTFSVAFGQGGRPVPPSQMFPVPPVPAPTRAVMEETLPVGYSVNPFANASSDFWGESTTGTGSGTQTSVRTKASSNPSVYDTFRTAEEADVPRYSLEDDRARPPPPAHRELPQWEEVRRSQLPIDLPFPQPQRQSQLLQPQPQIQPDQASVYTNASGKYEVLRDGRWVLVDAREMYRASVVSGVTHASGFSGASWAPGDDSVPLGRAPPPPVPAYRPFLAPPAARGFVGLPGKNIKPQTSRSGRVTQAFPPPSGGVLGGQAVPGGW